ncbi:carbohydrate ABC transporter ATP-binding protein, CUT1 family [Rhizobiales bacterium GAS113]|nr:carbohydrate ABC transporter ATP-binding protein, CUT1 family [Rhizobiales bacterium GAS113]
MADVELKKVRKFFGGLEVVAGVDVTVPDRSFTVFVGPSGCGKSTLLRLIAGLEDISAGDLLIDGVRVNDDPPARRGIAMVFQSYALYPHMTVFDNMAFGLRQSKTDKETIGQRVRAAARILELDGLLDRLPKQLSGGERQRVAIGRAITREPKVFLFDEPLSNLDAALRVQMRIEIAKLHKELGATMVYVTHDQVEAMTLAEQIVVLNAGRVEQVGPPLELYERPRNLFVAGFIGSPKMNLLPARVALSAQTGAAVELEDGVRIAVPVATDGLKAGDPVTLGIRPEHLMPCRDGPFAGSVALVERLGAETYVHLDLGRRRTLVLRQDGSLDVGEGMRLTLGPASDRFWHLFAADGTAFPAAAKASSSIPSPADHERRHRDDHPRPGLG